MKKLTALLLSILLLFQSHRLRRDAEHPDVE